MALLLVLAVQAVTGLFANDEIANAGPFYGWITQETSNRLTRVHEFNSNVAARRSSSCICAAVAWHDLVRRQRPGARDVDGSQGGGARASARRAAARIVIVLVLVGALALAIRAAPEASVSFF